MSRLYLLWTLCVQFDDVLQLLICSFVECREARLSLEVLRLWICKDCRMSKTVQEVERGSKNCSEERPVRKWGAWAQALRDIALRPEHASSVIQLTKEAVVIPDMYPKVIYHGLPSTGLITLVQAFATRDQHYSGQLFI